MQVELNLFGPLRDPVGRKTVTVTVDEGATVGDVLAALAAAQPALDGEVVADDGGVRGDVNVTLDGTDVRHLDGTATPVSGDSVVRVAPPVVGGYR